MTNGSRMVGRSEIYQSGQVYAADPLDDDLPDLSDPATVGCLLALVREAWGRPFLYCQMDRCWGDWMSRDGAGGFIGATEAESLIAALEAAP